MSAPHKEPMAFPMQYADDSYQQGMTLRDYFAAKAMAAILGSSKLKDDFERDGVAADAYDMADAMLEARQK